MIKNILVLVIVGWLLFGYALTLMRADPAGRVYIVIVTILSCFLLYYGLRHAIAKSAARHRPK